MKKIFGFLLLMIFFLSSRPFLYAQGASLPDISILDNKNPVPKVISSAESMGRVWNLVELAHYKVYYLPERNFPTDGLSYEQYMNNINFLLPRLDNVYVFLSKWLDVTPSKKLSVYYAGDTNQTRTHDLAREIYDSAGRAANKAKEALKKDSQNTYWKSVKTAAQSILSKYKERESLMRQVVSKEYILFNLLGYKKDRFIDWLIDKDARDAEFDNVLDNELPGCPPQDIKARKIELCKKILGTQKDITIDYGAGLKKPLSAHAEKIANMLFNNNTSYLAEMCNIDYHCADVLLRFKKINIGRGGAFALVEYMCYFNYYDACFPNVDIHEATHLFINQKIKPPCVNFLNESLCSYFELQAFYYFYSLRSKKIYNFHTEEAKNYKRKYPSFDSYLKNNPFIKTGEEVENIPVIESIRLLYAYMEQKDKTAFYEFLQYILGDEGKNIKPLEVKDALYKSYGLDLFELNEKLKKYYNMGIVE